MSTPVLTASPAGTDTVAALPPLRSSLWSDSVQLTVRQLRALARQPWYVALTIVQPMIWLWLFGALFRRVVELPGFAGGSYLDYIAPGVVVMSALFSGGWSGMGMIVDIDRGVMDRFLTSPVRRSALLIGRIMMQMVTIAIQSVIILGVALALGARFQGGVVGVLVLLGACMLLGATVSALSCALALLLRREESVIAAANFVLLPASFLSSSFMPSGLAPSWVHTISRYSPVDWSVVISRRAMSASPDWSLIWQRLGELGLLAVICLLLATRALRSYQRAA